MAGPRKMPFTRMRLHEFLSWDPDDSSGARWQMIDGEPVAMAPAGVPHGEIQAELAALLRNLLLGREPCRAITEPGIVSRVRADMNYRVPDIAVTCDCGDGDR
jgi:Uma2 family endonuclease